MSKATQTRKYIIERTAPIFNTKGYEGTSLADLTASTGLTKGSLYGNFTDKEDIAREAFRFTIERIREVAKTFVGNSGSPRQRLIKLLDFYESVYSNPPVQGGCPLLNTAIEADDYRISMKKVVASEINKSIEFMNVLLKQGVEEQEFHADTNTRELATVFFAAIEGGLMISKVSSSSVALSAAISHCKKIIKSITIK
ncbi:MAG: TetR/AcrR family transcriptional regulator [Cyclobacteriaceae bacterium]|nr:TetR/AcrR family transcriptional regulator [Cyclobacteriaceae bacterium]NBP69488.1 TetR/AcrR family transcriptional regulator [Cytophagia bacterium]NBW35854.1 TetR/AcrR family transcriptional regulator [Cytophagia bacterium]